MKIWYAHPTSMYQKGIYVRAPSSGVAAAVAKTTKGWRDVRVWGNKRSFHYPDGWPTIGIIENREEAATEFMQQD